MQRTLKKLGWRSCYANSWGIAHGFFIWALGNAKVWGKCYVSYGKCFIYALFTEGYMQVSVRWSS